MALETGWIVMERAPRDGTRIIATIRASEQGPSEVDLVYWSSADQAGMEGWRAADSHPGQVITYADPELICWMPLPRTAAQNGPRSPMPEPWSGDDAGELNGSGI